MYWSYTATQDGSAAQRSATRRNATPSRRDAARCERPTPRSGGGNMLLLFVRLVENTWECVLTICWSRALERRDPPGARVPRRRKEALPRRLGGPWTPDEDYTLVVFGDSEESLWSGRNAPRGALLAARGRGGGLWRRPGPPPAGRMSRPPLHCRKCFNTYVTVSPYPDLELSYSKSCQADDSRHDDKTKTCIKTSPRTAHNYICKRISFSQGTCGPPGSADTSFRQTSEARQADGPTHGPDGRRAGVGGSRPGRRRGQGGLRHPEVRQRVLRGGRF